MTSHTMNVTCLKWGGSGLIYSASQDRTIKVWRSKDGALCRTLQGHGHWVNVLALNTGTTTHAILCLLLFSVISGRKTLHLIQKSRDAVRMILSTPPPDLGYPSRTNQFVFRCLSTLQRGIKATDNSRKSKQK